MKLQDLTHRFMDFPLSIPLLAILVLTPCCVITGSVLLIWKKTRPLGLYVLMVEPGAVCGLILAVLVWAKLPHAVKSESQWVSLAIVGLLFLWLGFATLMGAIAGLALAAWLWWRFSPEPYRPLLTRWYVSLTTIPFPLRQRWGRPQPTRES
jgi:hypothetical protein